MNWVPILMRRSFLQYLVGVFQAIQKPLGCFLPRYGSNLGNARIPLRRHVYIKSHFEIYINKMGSNKKVTPGTPPHTFSEKGEGGPRGNFFIFEPQNETRHAYKWDTGNWCST